MRQSPLDVCGHQISWWPEKTAEEFSDQAYRLQCDFELRHATIAANDCPIPPFHKVLSHSIAMLANVGKASKIAHDASYQGCTRSRSRDLTLRAYMYVLSGLPVATYCTFEDDFRGLQKPASSVHAQANRTGHIESDCCPQKNKKHSRWRALRPILTSLGSCGWAWDSRSHGAGNDREGPRERSAVSVPKSVLETPCVTKAVSVEARLFLVSRSRETRLPPAQPRCIRCKRKAL